MASPGQRKSECGHIMVGFTSMTSGHIVKIGILESPKDVTIIKRPLKRGRLLVSPLVFSQPPPPPPPHYRLP